MSRTDSSNGLDRPLWQANGSGPASGVTPLADQAADESAAAPVIDEVGLAETIQAAFALNFRKLDDVGRAVDRQGQSVTALTQRDDILAHLHQRLAGLEQEAHQRSFIEPLLRKAAPIHRRLLEHSAHTTRAIEALPRPLQEHSTFFWARNALDAVRVELETLLGDFGIDVFTSRTDRFDRTCQEAIERVGTSQTNRVGTIARRIAPGFRVGERIVIAERVAVFVSRPHRTS